MKKCHIKYFTGLWEQKFETPFAVVELQRNENESDKELIARGLGCIGGAYPKSYHAKVEENE